MRHNYWVGLFLSFWLPFLSLAEAQGCWFGRYTFLCVRGGCFYRVRESVSCFHSFWWDLAGFPFPLRFRGLGFRASCPSWWWSHSDALSHRRRIALFLAATGSCGCFRSCARFTPATTRFSWVARVLLFPSPSLPPSFEFATDRYFLFGKVSSGLTIGVSLIFHFL